MIPTLFQLRRSALAAALLSLAVAVPAAADEVDEAEVEVDEYQITAEYVANWVFGNSLTRVAALDHAERGLETRLRLLHQAVTLTSSQREKLDLAGRGDIARFFEEYEALRRGRPKHQVSLDELNSYAQICSALNARWTRGLHGRASLFQKMIPMVLNAEQRARLDESRQAARKRQHDERIEEVLAVVEEKVTLTAARRKKIVALLESKTDLQLIDGSYKPDEATFLRSLTKIPEDDWSSIFPEAEWPRVRKALHNHQRDMREALGNANEGP